jgi:hypothetical protein
MKKTTGRCPAFGWLITNSFDQKQNDVICCVETKDTGNPQTRVYNKIAEQNAASEEPQSFRYQAKESNLALDT